MIIIIDEFHSYVRPYINPKLSTFCTSLTGIQQVCTYIYMVLQITTYHRRVIVQNGEEKLECEVLVNGMRLEHVLNLNKWGVFCMKQVQMRQCVVGRWRVGGKLQVLLGPRLM